MVAIANAIGRRTSRQSFLTLMARSSVQIQYSRNLLDVLSGAERLPYRHSPNILCMEWI